MAAKTTRGSDSTLLRSFGSLHVGLRIVATDQTLRPTPLGVGADSTLDVGGSIGEQLNCNAHQLAVFERVKGDLAETWVGASKRSALSADLGAGRTRRKDLFGLG